MSSLEIAELTGKRHDNIVRDIRSLLKQGVSHLNFEESSYKQPQPREGYKELPCFELTGKQHAHIMRDIRSLLAQGVSQSNFGLAEYSIDIL